MKKKRNNIKNSNKNLLYCLKDFYGLGENNSKILLNYFGFKDIKRREVPDDDWELFKKALKVFRYRYNFVLERKHRAILETLLSIKHYRSMRHKYGLPVRGQKTKSNGKTQKRICSIRLKKVKFYSTLNTSLKRNSWVFGIFKLKKYERKVIKTKDTKPILVNSSLFNKNKLSYIKLTDNFLFDFYKYKTKGVFLKYFYRARKQIFRLKREHGYHIKPSKIRKFYRYSSYKYLYKTYANYLNNYLFKGFKSNKNISKFKYFYLVNFFNKLKNNYIVKLKSQKFKNLALKRDIDIINENIKNIYIRNLKIFKLIDFNKYNSKLLLKLFYNNFKVILSLKYKILVIKRKFYILKKKLASNSINLNNKLIKFNNILKKRGNSFNKQINIKKYEIGFRNRNILGFFNQSLIDFKKFIFFNKVKNKSNLKLLFKKFIKFRSKKTKRKLRSKNKKIKKNKKKFIPKFFFEYYSLFIKFKRTNILLFLYDPKGNLKFSITGGSVGFKGRKRSSVNSIFKIYSKLKKKLFRLFPLRLNIFLVGFNYTKKIFIRYLKKREIYISNIIENTRVPFNGTRRKKLRR